MSDDITMVANRRGFAFNSAEMSERFSRYNSRQKVWIATYGNNNDGDAVINDIWKKYQERLSGQPSLPLITALVSRLSFLFGEFEDWVYVNVVKNGWVSDYGVDFIRDLIIYANGGQRKYTVTTWYDLVDQNPAFEHGFDGSGRISVLGDITIPSTEELLSNWVARDDGVTDLFITAHILFGSK